MVCFPGIRQSIAIGVGLGGVRAELEFANVEQTIPIQVGELVHGGQILNIGFLPHIRQTVIIGIGIVDDEMIARQFGCALHGDLFDRVIRSIDAGRRCGAQAAAASDRHGPPIDGLDTRRGTFNQAPRFANIKYSITILVEEGTHMVVADGQAHQFEVITGIRPHLGHRPLIKAATGKRFDHNGGIRRRGPTVIVGPAGDHAGTACSRRF